MTLDEIKRKARGLKQLAERAGTPEEAATAAGLLQKLLTKYKLDIAQIKNNEEEIAATRFFVGGDRMTLSWRRLLAHIVAEHTYCVSLYVKGSKTVDFIGKPADVEICGYLTDFLLAEVDRLFRQYRKDNPNSREAEKAPFGMGAVHAIGDTLERMRREEQQNKDVRALIRRESNKLKKIVEKHSKRTNVNPSFNNPAAFMEGMEAGAKIQIRKGLNDDAGKEQVPNYGANEAPSPGQ